VLTVRYASVPATFVPGPRTPKAHGSRDPSLMAARQRDPTLRGFIKA